MSDQPTVSSEVALPPRQPRTWLNALVAAGTALTLVLTTTIFFISSTTTSPIQADSVTESAEPGEPLSGASSSPEISASESAAPLPAKIDNVVLILADDLDWALFNQVPRLAALTDMGMTFTNHTVTDSLCCPSRVSIFRGQYIHNHRVISNIAKTGGGWPTFRDRREERDCLPVWLQAAGVETALYGKYLNDFPEKPKEATYVPPGWSDWGVPISRGDAYSGYNYILNENGNLKSFGNSPTDFLNDVITNKTTQFIRQTTKPFFVQLSTYSPHKPAPVADRNRSKQATTIAPRTPAYNAYGVDEPIWMSKIKPLSPRLLAKVDNQWRKRAKSAESVADSVEAVLATLKATGKDANTLVIVTSDNGYHMGERRMFKGKRTPYASDTVVPMILIGPGVPAGVTVNEMTSTIDLAPTITDLLGGSAPNWVDGRSLKDFIATGVAPGNWRDAALSESLGISTPDDPDYQKNAPPQYFALRTPEWLYVEYKDGSRTLYNRVTDPYEMVNVIKTADPVLVALLSAQLNQLSTCSGDTCRVADSFEFPQPAVTE